MIEPRVRHRRGRVRVEEAEHNDVEAVLAGREERAGIVIDQLDLRGVVRPLGVVPAAQIDDLRVDLDRRDLLDSVPQSTAASLPVPAPTSNTFRGLAWSRNGISYWLSPRIAGGYIFGSAATWRSLRSIIPW